MPLTLASVFTDNMVLQQQLPAPVWGTAAPGAKVAVAFAGQTVETTASADGNWSVKLAPLTASAKPAELVVTSTDSKLALRNILVGEVWVCSGQSNMGWPLSLCNDPDNEIAAAKFPNIRLLTVPQKPALKPMSGFSKTTWEECSPATASGFSGVGYFFGRELHRRLGVPVGLINSSWGGTVAEAWTSREAMLAEPDASVRAIVENFERDIDKLEEANIHWRAEVKAIEDKVGDHQNLGYAKGWAAEVEPADATWAGMDLPRTWQSYGLNFSGILWFRKIVDVPASWAGKDLKLSIGATDKSDTTYFNNVKVGSLTIQDRPDAWSLPRTYTVPGALVKAGPNVIAIRVHSDKYAGGATGPAAAMRLTCDGVEGSKPEPKDGAEAETGAIPGAGVGETEIPLAGTWRFAVEANYGVVQYPNPPMGPDNPNSPSVLYNGMISPLLPMAIRGAIWYQGESNVGRAPQYKSLFKAMIRDWRRAFKHEGMGFHFVQLANYLSTAPKPLESQWAELREAQAEALSLPHTGMAIAIDIGDGADIHPRNKQDVGIRLALNALRHSYAKKDIVHRGPHFREARVEGSAMRVFFDDIGGGLIASNGPLTGFAIAGPDGQFVWADARIDGNTVVVSSPAIAAPKAVRYAWADNPVCNLFNAAGLPASPFRTDAK